VRDYLRQLDNFQYIFGKPVLSFMSHLWWQYCATMNCAYFSAVWTQNIHGLTTNYATTKYISERQFCGPRDIQNREEGLVAT